MNEAHTPTQKTPHGGAPLGDAVDAAEPNRFEACFRDPDTAPAHPRAWVLGQRMPLIDALRGLFSGTQALVQFRLWCFLGLCAVPQGRLSRDELLQVFHEVHTEPLEAVLRRLRELELLQWDASELTYQLTPLAQQVQALLAPLTNAPTDDDEMGALLAQVAGAQQLGLVDAAHLQHLHAQLSRLHDDFADAIASGSETRLRLAQPRFERALQLVDKAGQALTALIRAEHEDPRLERAARSLGAAQARLLAMASQFTRALQQADRQRVTLGSTGLTTSDVRQWLQGHAALDTLLGEALSLPVRPVFVSQHDLVDVAEGEFERDRPDPQRSSGLPPAAEAGDGTLDVLQLPPELGGLIDLLGQWQRTPPPPLPEGRSADDPEMAGSHPLHDAVLGGRFAHAAYRLQLLPLLGDGQARTLKGQTGDLARMPWQLQFSAQHLAVDDPEVQLISQGLLRPEAGATAPTES
jgi:hypothetical protein